MYHIDLTGNKYGRLTVLRESGRTIYRSVTWECLCDCGNRVSITSHHLTSGHTQSCGCYQKDRAAEGQRTHGLCDTPTYHSWRGMKERCLNPQNKAYRWYGGNGVKICDRWLDFGEFLQDMGKRPKGMTIERIDTTGNYSPENCTWVPAKKQTQNTRSNVMVTHNGQTLCIAELARREKVPYGRLQSRLKKGWDVERALQA